MQPGSPSMPEPGRSCRKGGGYRTGPGWGDRRSGYGARASGDGGKAFSSSGQSSLLGRRSVRAPEREPTFLRIRWWEALQEADGLPVLRESRSWITEDPCPGIAMPSAASVRSSFRLLW
jgi:hypothetical protein